MWVGPCLVDQQIDTAAVLDRAVQPLLKQGGFIAVAKMRTHRVVADTLHPQPLHNVIGAVAVMDIAIKDPDAAHGTLLQQRQGSHHQPVERTKAFRRVIPSMVKTTGRRADVFSVLERMAGGCQQ